MRSSAGTVRGWCGPSVLSLPEMCQWLFFIAGILPANDFCSSDRPSCELRSSWYLSTTVASVRGRLARCVFTSCFAHLHQIYLWKTAFLWERRQEMQSLIISLPLSLTVRVLLSSVSVFRVQSGTRHMGDFQSVFNRDMNQQYVIEKIQKRLKI